MLYPFNCISSDTFPLHIHFSCLCILLFLHFSYILFPLYHTPFLPKEVPKFHVHRTLPSPFYFTSFPLSSLYLVHQLVFHLSSIIYFISYNFSLWFPYLFCPYILFLSLISNLVGLFTIILIFWFH